MDQPSQAVVETPRGRAAVAVVKVTGPAAVTAVNACFQAANGKPLDEQPIDAIRFGRWQNAADEDAGEELVVCRTDDSTVEVHCHGGHAAVRAVVNDLAEHGVSEHDWRKELGDGIASEAHVALADCVTDRAAAVLVDQLNGALQRDIQLAIEHLDHDKTAEAQAILDALLARSACGLHLSTPWRVVLVGPPNVGKSSLINALVGYERAIVYDQPGVTRDVVTANAAIDGWPVELADTAGLRAAQGEIEAAGIELARQVAGEAELLLLVESFDGAFDGAKPPGVTPVAELCDELGLDSKNNSRRLLRIANKHDLAPTANCGVAIGVSATSGEGIQALVAAIGQMLAPNPPPPGVGVPFTQRQVDGLHAAQRAINAQDINRTRTALQSLLAGASPD